MTASGAADRYKSYTATISATAGQFTLIAAHRLVDGVWKPTLHTQMYGAVVQIVSGFRIGYFYDYRPHAHSIGVQVLLF